MNKVTDQKTLTGISKDLITANSKIDEKFHIPPIKKGKTKSHGSISFGKVTHNAKNVEIVIKKPWWAFWRKNGLITMPSASVIFGDPDISNDEMSLEVTIKPEVCDD